jgi:hypothetical protein
VPRVLLLVNHFHLLIEPARWPVSRLMHQLNSSYVSRSTSPPALGHVLQGGSSRP